MGMPITVEIAENPTQKSEANTDLQKELEAIDKVFSYFKYVDETFSIYKMNSEISRINSGKLSLHKC